MPLHELTRVEYGAKHDMSQFIDIVAVHGLDENMFDAWTTETKVLWLRDLLPQSIPAARVLTYGYDASSTSFYGGGSVDRIQQHAHTLVADLQADRSLRGCVHRPIIFICHGLGGTLVKKALAYSSTRTSKNVDHLYSVFVSTFAIMFFGTPHNGADKANWLVSPSIHALKDSQLLSAVENSETLQAITDQFAPLMKQFHIFFFWEELPSKDASEFVVEEHSAAPIIPNTERSGIHATHLEMIRFSTIASPSYRTVVEALDRYCRAAPPIIARRQSYAAVALAHARLCEAQELTSTGIAFDVHCDDQPFQFQPIALQPTRNKYFFLPQAVSSVFTEREEMSQRVEQSLLAQGSIASSRQQRRCIVYGMGGSGKTQLCCKFAQDYREKFCGVFWVDATSTETAKDSLAKIGKHGGLGATADAGKHWLSQLEEPWLLIIDNADHPDLDLESLFPEGERGYILVTTRNPNFQLHSTVGRSIECSALERKEAFLLLLRSAGLPILCDPSTEDAVNKITSTLGYLALAVVQAGTHIRRGICGLKDYLSFWNEYCRKSKRNMSTQNGGRHEQYKVYSTLELSISSLEQQTTEASRDAVQLLSIAAFFHHEHIPEDVFSRAIGNRVNTLESVTNLPFSARCFREISSRFQPPPVLPQFLRQDSTGLDRYRVRQALAELQSFSLITYDGRDRSFSLHPVVHKWAQDRLCRGGQALWAQMALNTLAESILLPPDDAGEEHENFRTQILPHLDVCIAACPVRITAPWLPFDVIAFLVFRQQILRAAKFGYVYLERGRFDDAVEHLSAVKNALVNSRGYKDESTMRAMLALAEAYWGLGRLAEAIELQKKVIEARTKVFSVEHHETLIAMDKLGRSYWLNGQYYEAIELQILTTEKMKIILGPTHTDTLAARDNLGVTFGSWQRYQESITIHRAVLKSRRDSLDSSHLDTLTTMNNLAMALLDFGQLDEARELMVQVLEERTKKLGKEHPWTLWAHCNLAKIRLEGGQLKEVEEMLLSGIAAAKRSLGEDHLGVLMGRGVLARVYTRQHRFDEAEVLTRDIIHRLENSRGREHPDTVYAISKMGRLLELQCKFREAVEMYELAVKRAHLRLTNHPLGEKISSHLSNLKNSLAAQGEG